MLSDPQTMDDKISLSPEHPEYRVSVGRGEFDRGQRAISVLRQQALAMAVSLGKEGEDTYTTQRRVEDLLNVMLR